MKTAEQKAEEFIRKLCLGSYRDLLIEGLIKLIDEVDRNARLECVDSIDLMPCPSNGPMGGMIFKDKAINTIMEKFTPKKRNGVF